MLNFIDLINRYKENRLLAKHHCQTRAQYDRLTDPDFSINQRRIVDIYHGYAHTYCCKNENWFWNDDWNNHLREVLEWCSQNLEGKWRHDHHRVIWTRWENGWEVNEIGGGDYLFFAFKESKDYTMFLLRWG